jgi:hypothetical protein
MADRDIVYLSVILFVVIREVSMQIINQGFHLVVASTSRKA